MKKIHQLNIHSVVLFLSTSLAFASESNESKPTEIFIVAKGIEESTSATRIPIASIENPKTVDVLDKRDFQDSDPLRLEDSLSYMPGVTEGVTQGGFNTSAFIRGFGTVGGQVFVNGVLDNTRFYIRDFSTIERVEVLKGHSSVLYGSGSPGGTINYITKRPSKYAEDTLSLTVGSRKLKRLSIDKNGVLNRRGSLSYRLIATGQDGDHFYNNATNDRWIIAPSVEWKPTQKDKVNVDIEVAHTNVPFLFGTVYAKGQFMLDKSYIDPRARSDRQLYNLRSSWSHRFNNTWSLDTKLSYFKTKRDDLHIGLNSKLNEETLIGYHRKVVDDHSQYVGRLELRGTNIGKRLNHNLIIGVEKNKDSGFIDAELITDFKLDIEHPQFDTDFSLLTPRVRQYQIKNSETGVYALDKIDLNKQWNVLIGARYSTFHTDFIENKQIKLRSQRATSGSIALNYHPSKSFALYGSVSRSFYPNSGQDRNGNFFDPKQGLLYELGLRKHGPDYGIRTALFQIVQDNLLTADPEDRRFRVLVGEETVRGLETAFSLSPSPQLDIKAVTTYLDADVTRSNNGFQGNTPANIPKYSGALRLFYRPEGLSNTEFKLGLVGVGKKWGNRFNRFQVPGYGRVDMGIKRRFQKVTYSLNVRNLFDKEYVAASYGESSVYRGAPRTIWVSASYKF